MVCIIILCFVLLIFWHKNIGDKWDCVCIDLNHCCYAAEELYVPLKEKENRSGLNFTGMEEMKFLVLWQVCYSWSGLVDEIFQVYGFCCDFVPVFEFTSKVSPRACLHNCNYAFQWLWTEFAQQILFVVWFLSVPETCIILFIELLFVLRRYQKVKMGDFPKTICKYSSSQSLS